MKVKAYVMGASGVFHADLVDDKGNCISNKEAWMRFFDDFVLNHPNHCITAVVPLRYCHDCNFILGCIIITEPKEIK